jgi:hypothetical protein
MLVTLTISQWTARKHDRSVSNEVDKAHGAKDGGRYNKLLIRKEALDPMDKIASAARAYLYKMTFAWGDNGDRLLPAALFLEFGQTVSQFRNEFDARTREFVAEYPNLVQEARMRLGTLYDPADYPADVRSKFSFPTPAVTPVPSANDFRVNLSAEYVDSIKSDITERMKDLQSGTVKQCYTHLRNYISKIAERLGNEKSPIFDTLIEGPQEFLRLLPAMNLTNDSVLANFGQELHAILVPPDRLRQDKRLRAQVAAAADDILRRLPC